MQSYLQKIATLFANINDLKDYVFVFPNRRAGLFFRNYIAKLVTRPMFAPKTLTINDCFYSLSNLTLEDPTTTIFRLYKIYRDILHDAEPIDSFFSWGKRILSDFSEIDNHLTDNIEALFATIRDLKELDQRYAYLSERQREVIAEFWEDFWISDRQAEQDPNTHKRFLHIWGLLYPLYSQLHQQMLEQGVAYDGMLHRHLIENLDQIDETKLAKHYVFIGFNAMTKSEEALMLFLKNKGLAEFYFDYAGEYLKDKQNRASLFRDHNIQLFGTGWQDDEQEEQTTDQHISWISVPSTIGETYKINEILTQIAKQGVQDWTRTVVVMPDERQLLPMLNVIPAEIEKVNVTMGYPLNVTPAFALLQMLERLYTRLRPAGFYYKDMISMLEHRMIRAINNDDCNTLLHIIRDQNLIYISSDLIPESLQPIFRLLSSSAEAISLIRFIYGTLRKDEDMEAAARIILGLEHLEKIQDKGLLPELSARAFLMILRILVGDDTIPYIGEPLHGLQLMGVLETRALDFDNVIIAGFNDELYPGNSHSNSYIPYTLRCGFNLPTPQRQDAIFAYNFYHILSYAKNIWLLTNTTADDLHTGEPSRYLHQMVYQYHLPIDKQYITTDNLTRSTCSQRVKNTFDLQNFQFSPSSINTWITCPMRFYWQFIAKVKEPETVSEDIPANKFGTMMHSVLETLYKPYCNQIIHQEQMQTIITRLDKEWDSWDFLEQARRSPLAESALRKYVERILERDRLQLPFEFRETEYHIKHALTLKNGKVVHLKGVIDRIDRKADTERLLDYKSGSVSVEFKDIESLFDRDSNDRNTAALQTLIYCYMRSKEQGDNYKYKIEPHLMSVRLDMETSTLVHPKSQDYFDLQKIEQELVDYLQDTLQTIIESEWFEPVSDEKQCEKCTFKSLCVR